MSRKKLRILASVEGGPISSAIHRWLYYTGAHFVVLEQCMDMGLTESMELYVYSIDDVESLAEDFPKLWSRCNFYHGDERSQDDYH